MYEGSVSSYSGETSSWELSEAVLEDSILKSALLTMLQEDLKDTGNHFFCDHLRVARISEVG